MDSLPGATSLARALLTLSRADETGVLHVWAGRGARISIAGGAPCAATLEGADEFTLGDILVERGAFDFEAHEAAMLRQDASTRPVGRWLVEVGVTDHASLAEALRIQLHRRVAQLFRWPGLEYRFVAGNPDIGIEAVDAPPHAADLVAHVMRELGDGIAVGRARRQLGHEPLELTALGEALLRDAALGRDEAAIRTVLQSARNGSGPGAMRAVPVDDLLTVAGGGGRAVRWLWALKVLHAVTPPRAGASAYPLLLRKHRQVRRAADPATLLDLPEHPGPGQARRALRRLAGTLHPDRFGHATDPTLRRISGEVMSALVTAEAELRLRNHEH
jgi:hypothetical protein